MIGTLEYFKEHIDAYGDYMGPAHIRGDLNLRSLPNPPRSLGRLTSCGGLSIYNMSLDSLGNLTEVKGDFRASGSTIKEPSQLRVVEGGIFMSDVCSGTFDQLTKAELGIYIGNCPIPFFTKLDLGTIVRSQHFAETPYKNFLLKVVNTPVEELVNLRVAEPTLTHLVDARLQGLLKK